MTYSLKGRNVLVTAGSRGLGALACVKFAEEGCNVAINYVANAAAAEALKEKLEKDYGVKSHVVQGDASSAEDNARLVKEAAEMLGGLDVIVANAGWTRQTRRGDIYDLSHDEWNKCWSTNVMSHVQLMQSAAPIFNANADGGVYLITSSIAGISTMASSMGYAVTKAASLHLMKNMAKSMGPKIRINAVLPGLLLTDWGMDFGPQATENLKNRVILKHETFLEDCAKTFIWLAQNTSVTGQSIIVDSGLLEGSL